MALNAYHIASGWLLVFIALSANWNIRGAPSLIFARAFESLPSITNPNQYCTDTANSLFSCEQSNHALKVLVVPQNFPHPSLHGSDKRVFHILENLIGLGHSVSVAPFAPTTAKLTEFDHLLLGQLHNVDYPTKKKPMLATTDPTESFKHVLHATEPDVVIIWLWFWDHRFTAPGQFGNYTANYCMYRREVGKRCRYLVFTDDAHSSRQTQLASQQRLKTVAMRGKRRALKMAEKELEAYSQADKVVAITSSDQGQIISMGSVGAGNSKPSLFTKVMTVRFVSSSWEQLEVGSDASGALNVAGDLPSFADRRGLVFVGNGKNPTNVQALRWYLTAVATRLNDAIHRREHELAEALVRSQGLADAHGHDHYHDPRSSGHDSVVKLLVVGGYWDKKVLLPASNGEEADEAALLDRYISFSGYASTADMLAHIDGSRVFISPIVVSTGINTKNVLALSRGIPLVTTVAGASGMCEQCDELKQKQQQSLATAGGGGSARGTGYSHNISDGVPFFIAPSVDSLIDSVVQAYLDEPTWTTYHRAGINHVSSWFDKDSSATELDKALFAV